ncbi:flagellin [Comamonas aquatica]|uniref:flagellin N-terminal helical domain-containing protein n=1 Tax=Comamonas aquatica TaxID=225991 RepID=UPI002447848C|nr:flagellin [Comamonas aquatica]MDH1901740.1 flagellin [Comamonas aquatica]
MPTINTNLPSLTAQRHLSASQLSLTTTMQRLSSGLRVNSAKDDAAGLAISERMNTQVRGMAVASRNANDGISLSQVAEGAMQKLTDILQRSRELAVQAANATNSNSDRQALDTERAQLLQEFARIASTSNFNGQKLIDGSFMAQSFQVGANVGEVIGVYLPSLQAPNLGAYGWPLAQSPTTNSYAITRGNDEMVPAGDLVLRGKPIAIERNESMASIAQRINDAGFDPKIYAQASTSVVLSFNKSLPPSTPPVAVTVKLIAGDDLSKAQTVSFTWDHANHDIASIKQAINAVSGQTGVRAEDGPYADDVRLVNDAGETIRVLNDSAPGVSMLIRNNIGTGNMWTYGVTVPGANGAGVLGAGAHDIQVQGNFALMSEDSFAMDGGYYNLDGDPIGPFPAMQGTAAQQFKLTDARLDTAEHARQALIIYDAALRQVTSARADVGAVQSRFESVIANIDIAAENMAASRSRIVDADYAVETAKLAQQQILQDAGTAMLAQAHSVVAEQALALLKDV